MVDHQQNQTVCCMCGDMGFSDKLFRCTRCCYRSQHSYCSNYYRESSSDAIQLCDWCQSEERNSRQQGNTSSLRKSTARPTKSIDVGGRGDNKLKQHDHKSDDQSSSEKAVKSPSGTPSPRTPTRRYKLLKDVMC